MTIKGRLASQKIDTLANRDRSKEYCLVNKNGKKIKETLNAIFVKFTKHEEKKKRKYYHSVDIFKRIQQTSDDEDS